MSIKITANILTKLRTCQKPLLALFVLIACTPISHAVADRQQAATYYEEAVIFHNDDKPEEAIIQLKNALQQDSNLLAARVLLGKIYLETGTPSATEKELREAEQLGADRSLTAIPLAKAYLKQLKYAEIITELPLENYPASTHGELLTYHGHAYLESNKPKEANKAFQKAAKHIPESPIPVNGIALLYLRIGDIKSANNYADQALAITPNNIEALMIKASIFHTAGQLNQAIDGYSNVLQRDPKHLEARLARAGIYLDTKRFTESMSDLDFMEKHYPLEPRAIYLKSLIYAFQNKPQESKQALLQTADIIEQLRPEFLSRSRAHLMLAGLTYHALENFELAQTYLSNLLLITPEALGPKKLLAAVYAAQGKHDEVVSVLQPIVNRTDVNDYKILTMLGEAYTQKSRYKKATKLLERAVALSNNNPDSRVSLAVNYYISGESDKAVNELSALFEKAPDKASAGTTLASIHIKQNQPLKALKVLKQIKNKTPDDIAYLNLTGTAQVMAKQMEAARTSFEKILAIAPDFIPAQINLARVDNLTGNTEQARERLRSLLTKQNINSYKVMLELAKTEEVAGNMDEAIRWAEKIRVEKNDHLASRRYLTRLYQRNNDLDNALEIALEAKRLAPTDLEIMQIVAQIYIAQNDLRSARTELREMSSLAGFDSRWLYRIARMQYQIKVYKEAEYSLQKAVQEDPGFIDAQVALIEILIGLNKLDEAEERTKAQLDNAAFTDTDRLLGDIALRRGDHDKAMTHYQMAMRQAPSSQLNVKLYQAYGSAGKWQQAAELMDNWLKQQPDDLNGIQALAEAYIHLDDFESAIAQYEQALKKQPQNSMLLSNLAFLYLKTGNNSALPTAQKAHELAPEDAAVSDTLGWILVNQGQTKQGLIHLRDAHSRASHNPEIRYHIAVALAKLGRNKEATEELEQALASPHSFDGIEQARQLQKQLYNLK